MISFAVVEHAPIESGIYGETRRAFLALKVGQALRLTGFANEIERDRYSSGFVGGSISANSMRNVGKAAGWKTRTRAASEDGVLVLYLCKVPA